MHYVIGVTRLLGLVQYDVLIFRKIKDHKGADNYNHKYQYVNNDI